MHFLSQVLLSQVDEALERRVMLWLQTRFTGKAETMLTLIGKVLAEFLSPNGLVGYFAGLYWLNAKYKCAYGVWLIPISVLLNGHIKWLFRAARPCWIDVSLKMKDWSDEYSFPSGHSQIVCALATFFMEANRRDVPKLLSSDRFLMIFSAIVCLSRVYMGVHYPKDAIAGALFGIVLAKVFIALLPVIRPRLAGLSVAGQIVVFQVLAACAWKCIQLQHKAIVQKPDLDLKIWELNSGRSLEPIAVPLASYIGQIGVLSGLGFGVPFLKYIPLPPPRGGLKSALRLLSGYSGLLGIYFFIRFLEYRACTPYSLAQQFARFARFASVAPTVFVIMPSLFNKLDI